MFKSTWIIMALMGALAFAGDTMSPRETYHRGVSLAVEGGLVTTSGEYGGAFLLGISTPVSKTAPVRIGFESGVMFSKDVSLPLLISFWWDVQTSHNVSPYVGGSIGPAIGLSSSNDDPVFGSSRASIRLAMLLRPGLNFELTDNLNLNAEIQMGGLTGLFYIAPTLGLQLLL